MYQVCSCPSIDCPVHGTYPQIKITTTTDNQPQLNDHNSDAADELGYGIDMGSAEGDETAIAISKGKKLWSYVGEDAEVIIELIAASNRQTLQTVLDKMPEKEHTGIHGVLGKRIDCPRCAIGQCTAIIKAAQAGMEE